MDMRHGFSARCTTSFRDPAPQALTCPSNRIHSTAAGDLGYPEPETLARDLERLPGIAQDDDERGRRAQRLGIIEATFHPVPFDAAVAREWGRLAAAVVSRGAQPRRRAVELVIAATANAHRVPLLTHNVKDFQVIAGLADTHNP